MFLPGIGDIGDAFDLIWKLTTPKVPGQSQVDGCPEAVSAVEHNTFLNKPPPLFALIIGIDRYKYDDFENLEGAVADGETMKTYLETSLGVPTSQIKTLFDEEATRDVIISSLRALKSNPSIRYGDPILIYYAGHGGLAETPVGWEAGGPTIQVLVSHEALCDSDDNTVHGIPDRTIGVLLEQIAQEKGDNITVIFDCCHSGSLTRKGRRVRGVKTLMKIPPNLDKDIWGGRRGTSIAPGFLKTGLRSHVLLSACGAEEYAHEEKKRGYFTKRLIDALEAAGADMITYTELLQRIPCLPSQNPQCEGYNQNRICFDSKAPVQSTRMYPVRKVDQEYLMAAGTMHGITDGAMFALYNDRSALATKTPVATMKASEPIAFSTNLIPSSEGAQFDISEGAFALLIRAGDQEDLRIHVEVDQKLMSVFQALASEMQISDPAQPKIMLVKKETAELDIASDGTNIVFNIMDPLVTIHGLNRIPFTIEPTPRAITPVIRKAARYFWHLRRTGSTNALQTKVGIEFTELENVEEEYDEELNPVRRPCGPNLINDGIVDIVVDANAIYGVKIINKWNKPLYTSQFYFDSSDLSITSYFQPATSSGKVDPPLLPHGSITIGYGSGGGAPFNYSLRTGQDVDVGFLKLFISTEQVDLSSIQQSSPFEEANRVMRTLKEKPCGSWSTSLITIVQRRYPSD